MDDESTVDPSPEEDLRSPGELLSRGRERLGLSEEDVAVQLNLSVIQVRALEQNRFGDLPGKTYVRGYLQSYARLVGCDESDVFRNFNLQEDASIRGLKPVFKETGGGGRYRKIMTLVVVVLLGGLSFMWWQSRLQQDVASTGTDRVQQGAGSIYQSPDQVEVMTNPPSVEPSRTESSAGPQELQQEPETAAAVQPEADLRARIEAEEQLLTREQDAGAAVAPAPPPGDVGRKVRLEFNASSWVDLRDSDGRRLLYEHIGQGRQVVVEGKPPFSVFLGNAEGVRIEYDGSPYDFSEFINGVYARFELGAGEQ